MGDARKVLGVVGGMGPLASAEFVKTIYECGPARREQEAPAVVLLSDPSTPDRTELLLGGDCRPLVDGLASSLSLLLACGASKVVVCCVTMHHVLPRLPRALRERVVSLPDVIFSALAASRESHLLLCTSGARKMRLFQSHPEWANVKGRVVLPDEGDQHTVHHEIIYRLKQNCRPETVAPLVESLMRKYGVDSFVAGCTELHLLAKRPSPYDPARRLFRCLDPLTIIAEAIAKEGI
ncbi:MAG TPA: amino acid racemase [Pyrinomonadaceae bacterium]|nr:amino acid racemase [Pyrinomonadaceae bacterium]